MCPVAGGGSASCLVREAVAAATSPGGDGGISGVCALSASPLYRDGLWAVDLPRRLRPQPRRASRASRPASPPRRRVCRTLEPGAVARRARAARFPRAAEARRRRARPRSEMLAVRARRVRGLGSGGALPAAATRCCRCCCCCCRARALPALAAGRCQRRRRRRRRRWRWRRRRRWRPRDPRTARQRQNDPIRRCQSRPQETGAFDTTAARIGLRSRTALGGSGGSLVIRSGMVGASGRRAVCP